MATYKDINLSMELTSSNDIAILEDVEAIKNTLYNNLLIAPQERYFDNTQRMDMRDLIHSQDTFLTRTQLKDAINEAIKIDSRITALNAINFNFNDDDNSLEIDLELETSLQVENEIVLISLIFDKG